MSDYAEVLAKLPHRNWHGLIGTLSDLVAPLGSSALTLLILAASVIAGIVTYETTGGDHFFGLAMGITSLLLDLGYRVRFAGRHWFRPTAGARLLYLPMYGLGTFWIGQFVWQEVLGG